MNVENLIAEIHQRYEEIDGVRYVRIKFDHTYEKYRMVQLGYCIAPNTDALNEHLVNFKIVEDTIECINKMNVFGLYEHFDSYELRMYDLLGLRLCDSYTELTGQVVEEWYNDIDFCNNLKEPFKLKQMVLNYRTSNHEMINFLADDNQLDEFIQEHYKPDLTFPELIKKMMEKYGNIKSTTLCNRVNLSKTTFSNYKNANKPLSNRKHLLKILLGLRCSTDDAQLIMRSLGFGFCPSNIHDVVVFYGLHEKVRVYNLSEINKELNAMGVADL